MRRSTLAFLAVAGVALVCAPIARAATMTPDQAEAYGAEKVKGKTFTVGLYCHSNQPPWKILQNAAIMRAKELSEKYGFTLNLDIQAPPTHVDIIRQSNIMDDFIAKKVDMIVAIPVTTGSMEALIKKVGDAKIPMGLFITSQDPPVGYDSTVKWWLYNDDRVGGKYVGDYMAKVLPHPAKVTIMRGVYESLWDQDRYAGIVDGLRPHPDIEVLDVQQAAWERDPAMQRTQEWIARYGDQLDGILSLNDEMGWGIYAAAQAAGLTKLHISGWDGARDFAKGVRDGTFDVSVDMHWMGYGIQLVDLMFETLKGNDVKPLRNLLRLSLIDKAYAQKYLDEANATLEMKKPDTWDSYKLFNYRAEHGTNFDLGVDYRVK